jgi:hypothetical protein
LARAAAAPAVAAAVEVLLLGHLSCCHSQSSWWFSEPHVLLL